LFDQLRLDLQVPNQRATPALTPAHLGEEELNTLRNSNRVSTFGGEKGQPACLNITEFELLASQSSESEIVACLTPIFDHIFEDLVVVNAEEYTWLEVSTNTIRYNQKPDMLVCHGAIYQKREASKTSDATESLRTPYFKFGVLSNWVLRDCISVILEAKTKIDNHSFGEVINYGRHVSLHHPEPNDVRIVLFDKTEFWLVTFASGVCAMVTKCQWMVEGSRKLLKDFAKASKWIEVLDSVCKELDLVVAEGRAFLGYGSFGRVFRVFRRNGGRSARDELALKIVLGVDSLELRTETGYLRQAFSRTPDHVVEVTEFKEVQKGAGLLLACVGRPILKSEFSSVIEALATLHANHIYHGDPRLANAVVAGRTVKWIDFRGACFHPVTTPKHFLHDMNILVCSVLSVSSLSLLPSVEEAVKKYARGEISPQQLSSEVLP
jgi:hypothetical protein